MSGKQYHNGLNKILYNTVNIVRKYLVIWGINLPYTVGCQSLVLYNIITFLKHQYRTIYTQFLMLKV